MIYAQFLLSATAVAIAGTYLSKYGDVISKKTGLSGMWIGAVFVAIGTSLPEVLSDVSAARMGVPDMAVGDIFGSGMANMLILAIIALLYKKTHRKSSLLRDVTLTHTTTAALAILLTALTALFILISSSVHIFKVGVDTATLAAIYLIAMWTFFRSEKAGRETALLDAEPVGAAVAYRGISLKRAASGFLISVVIIGISAPMLVSSVEAISSRTGISVTFMGTLFLALVTSAPELAVSISAVRLGAFDLAVGDLFGSNAFNIFALFLTDLAFRQGTLLAAISDAHIGTALVLLILMSIAMIGLVFRAEKRYFLLLPDAVLIIVIFVLGLFMVFQLSAAG